MKSAERLSRPMTLGQGTVSLVVGGIGPFMPAANVVGCGGQ